jgi:hypothetical protein
MKIQIRTAFLFLCFIAAFSSCNQQQEHSLQLGMWDYDWMKQVKTDLNKGHHAFRSAYEQLIADADKALQGGVYSVTFKEIVPPSGSKNDYMSMGPYWWPDPEKPDGLPYIRRDGVINPERDKTDRPQVGGLINDVRILSLSWYFSGESKYAEKAAQLLRVWFLEPETLMNPHLEYGQAIPGRTTGRGIGIIDTKGFSVLVDAIALLETSGHLSDNEKQGIRSWFEEYFRWLTESQHGKDEDAYPNNHSVAYDVQVAGIAYFLGNHEYVARKIDAMKNRIDKMIEEDGKQPAELIRTRAFGYSVGNLGNFFDAADIGLKAGVNVFDYVNQDGGSFQKALDYLIGYIGREEDWPYEEISDWKSIENNLGRLVRRAGHVYENNNYRTLYKIVFYDRLKDDWGLLVIPGKTEGSPGA